MRTLNLGILAHVDAGKTSLTERLLHAAGVIDRIGHVNDGTTQTYTLALERARGITIKNAVASFAIDDATVNLIDTPGHPDFIAEVERVLGVLDGVVLVLSAVEGVQPQTRILFRALQRLRIPTMLFVNKIDRAEAGYDRVLAAIGEKLSRSIVAMGAVLGAGTLDTAFEPFGPDDPAFVDALTDRLVEHDDELLAAAIGDVAPISFDRLRDELASQTGRALVHPVFFGSAITGAGVEPLMAAVGTLLPAADADGDGPVSGTVFKVERGTAGERIAYVRLFSGTIRTRDRVPCGADGERTVTAIAVFDRGPAVRRPSVTAGQIARLWGLGEVRIGDALGLPPPVRLAHRFDPPTLETVVAPIHASDAGVLHAALGQLAEQDPLIDVRRDDERHEISVSLYGEVQKEVIGATLADDFGIEVGFRETTTICVERPAGTGAALEVIGEENPFLATIGLRVDRAAPGSGVTVALEVEHGSIPLHVYGTVEGFGAAIERTVHETLRQGLCGWRVLDCHVAVTRCGYLSPGSSHGDFKRLTPLVLMHALKLAGTVVCEPMHGFRLEGPSDAFGPTMRTLARLDAVTRSTEITGLAFVAAGKIPAARVHEFRQRLPGVTGGEGALETKFDGYRPIAGPAPTRPRTGLDPRDRETYLLHLSRRM